MFGVQNMWLLRKKAMLRLEIIALSMILQQNQAACQSFRSTENMSAQKERVRNIIGKMNPSVSYVHYILKFGQGK